MERHPLWRWRGLLLPALILLVIWAGWLGLVSLLKSGASSGSDAFSLVILLVVVALPGGLLVLIVWSYWILRGASVTESAQGIAFGALEKGARRLWASWHSNQGELWFRWAMQARYQDQALAYLEEAARRRHVEANFELGLFYEEGGFGEGGKEAAMKYYHRAAELGHGEAAFRLAELYRWGNGVLRNPTEAHSWCARSAQRGFPPAMERLTVAYERGEGVEADPEEAARWRSQMAERSLGVGLRHSSLGKAGQKSDALEALGRFWRESLSALEDVPGFGRFTTATAWVAQVLAVLPVFLILFLGLAFAGIFLIPGLISIVGLTILHFQLRRDCRYSRESLRLEKRAATGDAEACFRMGMAYQTGTRDIPRDPPMARPWLQRAAEAGHVQAMVELGDLLAWDAGRRDPEAARGWLQRAAQAGSADAKARLDRMSGARDETSST